MNRSFAPPLTRLRSQNMRNNPFLTNQLNNDKPWNAVYALFDCRNVRTDPNPSNLDITARGASGRLQSVAGRTNPTDAARQSSRNVRLIPGQDR